MFWRKWSRMNREGRIQGDRCPGRGTSFFHLIRRTRHLAHHLETKERGGKVTVWTRIRSCHLSILSPVPWLFDHPRHLLDYLTTHATSFFLIQKHCIWPRQSHTHKSSQFVCLQLCFHLDLFQVDKNFLWCCLSGVWWGAWIGQQLHRRLQHMHICVRPNRIGENTHHGGRYRLVFIDLSTKILR